MESNWGLFVLVLIFLFSSYTGVRSQGLFSSFEMGTGLSKTAIVDKRESTFNTLQFDLDFGKQWHSEVHVSVWETEKLEYDFGISLTKSFLDYGLVMIFGTDIDAGTETKINGQQENWDVDISGGVFYKIVSDERNHFSVGPEFVYRKTFINLFEETVISDTIVDGAVHDVFSREVKRNTFEIGAKLKYAYLIKPGIGIYVTGFTKLPYKADTITFFGIEEIFSRLHVGFTLGMKIRIKPD